MLLKKHCEAAQVSGKDPRSWSNLGAFGSGCQHPYGLLRVPEADGILGMMFAQIYNQNSPECYLVFKALRKFGLCLPAQDGQKMALVGH